MQNWKPCAPFYKLKYSVGVVLTLPGEGSLHGGLPRGRVQDKTTPRGRGWGDTSNSILHLGHAYRVSVHDCSDQGLRPAAI